MNQNVQLLVSIQQLINVYRKKLGGNLESLGMQPTSYAMLAHLNTKDRAKTQKLGDVAMISSGAITNMVNKMEKQGLVQKVTDENDKRITWVEITEKGRTRYNEVNEIHMEYVEKLLSGFSYFEKNDFIDKLRHFRKSIERRDEE